MPIKGQLNHYAIILFLLVFATFTVTITGMAGSSLSDYGAIRNLPAKPATPVGNWTILDYLTWPFAQLTYFLSLMTISSDFALLGIIMIPLTIMVLFIVVLVLRGSV